MITNIDCINCLFVRTIHFGRGWLQWKIMGDGGNGRRSISAGEMLVHRYRVTNTNTYKNGMFSWVVPGLLTDQSSLISLT